MPRIRGQVTTISASSAKTTSSTSATQNLGGIDQAVFILNVSASSSPTTLDVYLQSSPDTGTTWYDFGHFTQVGAVATSIQMMQWSRSCTASTGDTSVLVSGDAALASAKIIMGPICDKYFRAKWTIAGTSYTFSLLAITDTNA